MLSSRAPGWKALLLQPAHCLELGLATAALAATTQRALSMHRASQAALWPLLQ
jgi:hypothetical protein